MDMKSRMNETVRTLELENKELRTRNREVEIELTEIRVQTEKRETILQQKMQALEKEKNQLAIMNRLYEEEKRQWRDASESETAVKLREMKELVESLREEHSKDLQKMHDSFDGERQMYENRVKEVLATLKKEQNHVKREIECQTIEPYPAGVSEAVIASYESRIDRSADLLANERRAKDEALKRCDYLDAYLTKLKNELQSSLALSEQQISAKTQEKYVINMYHSHLQ
jgi:hypothetical protein